MGLQETLGVFSVVGQLGLSQLGAKTLQHLGDVFDRHSETLNGLQRKERGRRGKRGDAEERQQKSPIGTCSTCPTKVSNKAKITTKVNPRKAVKLLSAYCS